MNPNQLTLFKLSYVFDLAGFEGMIDETVETSAAGVGKDAERLRRTDDPIPSRAAPRPQSSEAGESRCEHCKPGWVRAAARAWIIEMVISVDEVFGFL